MARHVARGKGGGCGEGGDATRDGGSLRAQRESSDARAKERRRGRREEDEKEEEEEEEERLRSVHRSRRGPAVKMRRIVGWLVSEQMVTVVDLCEYEPQEQLLHTWVAHSLPGAY